MNTKLPTQEQELWNAYNSSFNKPQQIAITDDSEYGGNTNLLRVGQGKQTNHRCGQHLGVKACLNVELHSHVSLDGINHTGNIYLKKIISSCDSPECPVCFLKGWSVREASAIDSRIKKFSKGYTDNKGKKHSGLGLAEHIICSVPVSDYGLSFPKLKTKVIRILRELGVLGGVLIFHAQRFRNAQEALRDNKPKGWYFAPHFHTIAFIDGGFAKCRNCPNYNKFSCGVYNTERCLACEGFEGRARRKFFKGCQEYEKKQGAFFDEFGNKRKIGGYILKVKGARRTIHGTAWYQLNHATLVRGSKRSTVTTWFGACSYVKMKLEKGDRIRRDICPICQHELIEVIYVGNDANSPVYQWWVKEWEEPYLDKDGLPNWIAKPKGLSGSYEKTF